MRVTAIQAKQRASGSTGLPNKHKNKAALPRMTPPSGLLCPTQGARLTAGITQSEKCLICWPLQSILLSDGRPLGECPIKTLLSRQ
jgi:hypothetical protein